MILVFKNLLFTLLVPGTVAVYLPHLLAGERSLASGAGCWAGVALWGAGASIYAWCVWDFARFGRGTPAPIDAPVHLVVRGLYRSVRNPMYVGVLTTILGWASAYSSFSHLAYAALVGTLFHLFIVLYEEPHLRAVFGEEYVRYTGAVARWIPRPPIDTPPSG